ncbi:MAG: heavy metal translocating P-type ATPase [Thermoanaerobaculum sp.]
MAKTVRLEVPIKGMDCAQCAHHVEKAIAKLPGVAAVEVFLAAEKAVVHGDPQYLDLAAIRHAVAAAGYSVPEMPKAPTSQQPVPRHFTLLLAAVFALVLLVVVAGEWLGLFGKLNAAVPFPLGLALVLVGGYPVFRPVVRAALQRRITSHTLMTLGAFAALAVGEWVAAAIVVLFMRVGHFVERFTGESARQAVKDLTLLAPQTARVERGGEVEVPVSEVKPGETVIVRPGERIPVDGEVVAGHATVDQAAITGEAMPVEAGPGFQVFAATLATLGSLRIRATRVGEDTTFGRVIKLVEEAEAHRAEVQRLADKFSGYYLPVVAGVAAVTWLFGRNPLAAASVLVVACSCSFALATPVAMLAAIGAAAKRGLLIKGGKYLEELARADVVLVDKTGTLTLGRPQITDVIPLNHIPTAEILRLAASAERYSEHPLAEAVRAAAFAQGLSLFEPEAFTAIPGLGVQAQVNGHQVVVGSPRLAPEAQNLPALQQLQAQGKTLLLVVVDGQAAGVLAAADTLRPEVPQALAQLKALGIQHVELLTGDNPQTAGQLAEELDVRFHANLLPEDKIRIVKEYQSQGHKVVMVGDGVNDAPALAQANVGIAMGAAGTDVALEAAHIALMREDWKLVPAAFRLAHRTRRVVLGNLLFTALYNLVGLSLAALGFLPPTVAAAAQSLPDLGILGNSARLLQAGNSK